MKEITDKGSSDPDSVDHEQGLNIRLLISRGKNDSSKGCGQLATNGQARMQNWCMNSVTNTNIRRSTVENISWNKHQQYLHQRQMLSFGVCESEMQEVISG